MLNKLSLLLAVFLVGLPLKVLAEKNHELPKYSNAEVKQCTVELKNFYKAMVNYDSSFKSNDPIKLYLDGNGSCEGSNTPCWALPSYPNQTKDDVLALITTWAGNFESNWGDVSPQSATAAKADICMARAYLKNNKLPLPVNYGPLIQKAYFGCVAVENIERFTDITPAGKRTPEILRDAMNLTLVNHCQEDQIVGLIIKYDGESIDMNDSAINSLQMPDSPYFDVSAERQWLTTAPPFGEDPFAATTINPYQHKFVPEQSINRYAWTRLLPGNKQSKGKFIPWGGTVDSHNDPRAKSINYYIASCNAMSHGNPVGMFWDPNVVEMNCAEYQNIRVIP